MVTHPTFYVGRLKRYHDPLGPSPRMEEGQGESSPPRNEAESSGQPEQPVSEPANEIQTGTDTYEGYEGTAWEGLALEPYP
ncbi:Pol protein [Phytophthora palmivora]|uniref:Pol protein n=1 Tax=Phytophthora palmivora TaxID=4796 RepID=A0A2P4WYM5_9STRA|nr:Pol protein [Phytophthora palmivora]